MENINSDFFEQSKLLASMFYQNGDGGNENEKNYIDNSGENQNFIQDFFSMYFKAQKILAVINEPILMKPAENRHFVYMLKDAMPYIDNSLTKTFNAFVKLVELKGVLETQYPKEKKLDSQSGLLKAMLPHVPEHHREILLSYIKIEEIKNILESD